MAETLFAYTIVKREDRYTLEQSIYNGPQVFIHSDEMDRLFRSGTLAHIYETYGPGLTVISNNEMKPYIEDPVMSGISILG